MNKLSLKNNNVFIAFIPKALKFLTIPAGLLTCSLFESLPVYLKTVAARGSKR